MQRWLAIAIFAAVAQPALAQRDLPVDLIKLPPGFRIEVAARVESAREMALGAKGTLFVGSIAGKVYAVKLKSGAPGAVTTIAAGLNRPVALHSGTERSTYRPSIGFFVTTTSRSASSIRPSRR